MFARQVHCSKERACTFILTDYVAGLSFEDCVVVGLLLNTYFVTQLELLFYFIEYKRSQQLVVSRTIKKYFSIIFMMLVFASEANNVKWLGMSLK